MTAPIDTKELKIFLVDDQKITNFINKKIIDIAGVSKFVYDFIDPKEALDKLEENQPNLILLDLNMPDIDGWGFLDRMEEKNTDAKVVIVTSSTSPFDVEKAKNYNRVIQYITKPLNKDILIGFVNQYKKRYFI
ncbi:response regulator [Leeuwenhoekiella sp. A16]|uniref:response regulator n=1 Tax=unclassified Leeuwenhoekiella TaxID=2615029 RepID=UPI003A809FCA